MCVEWALLLHLLLLACEQGVDGCVELVAALEEVELEDEDVARDGAAEFLHECAGCRCRAACSMESASCTAHCLRVYLPVAMMSSTISTFCPGLIASACIWKKSLPYSFWYSAVSQGPGSLPRFLTGTNAAPSLNARIETHDNVGVARARKLLLDGDLERADKTLVELRVCENGQDVLKQNAGLGEIGELAQRRLELYLKTGEFGGGGGMGGGESSLGGMAVALERGVWGALWRVCGGCVALERRVCGGGGVERVFAVCRSVGGGGHYEEEKGRKGRQGQGGMMRWRMIER
jgi:hypothetical protein